MWYTLINWLIFVSIVMRGKKVVDNYFNGANNEYLRMLKYLKEHLQIYFLCSLRRIMISSAKGNVP